MKPVFLSVWRDSSEIGVKIAITVVRNPSPLAPSLSLDKILLPRWAFRLRSSRGAEHENEDKRDGVLPALSHLRRLTVISVPVDHGISWSILRERIGRLRGRQGYSEASLIPSDVQRWIYMSILSSNHFLPFINYRFNDCLVSWPNLLDTSGRQDHDVCFCEEGAQKKNIDSVPKSVIHFSNGIDVCIRQQFPFD